MDKNRVCKECGERIVGRSDRKFCSDMCRISYNNNVYRERNRRYTVIDKVLKANHRILSSLYERGQKYFHISDLRLSGFDFGFITSIEISQSRGVEFRCYDLAYTLSDNGRVEIFKNPDI